MKIYITTLFGIYQNINICVYAENVMCKYVRVYYNMFIFSSTFTDEFFQIIIGIYQSCPSNL